MKHFLRQHASLATIVVSLASFAVFVSLAEAGFRAVRYIVSGGPQAIPDPELGWTLNPQRKPARVLNACGEHVVRDPPPSRYLGKLAASRGPLKVLFVGDSYTQAHTVSTGAAYYDVFERLNRDRYAVYAAGVSGYGTVQEYLLLRKLYPEVKPDIVVWQLADNDVRDNVFVGRDINTVQFPRPYLDPASQQLYFADPAFWVFAVSDLAKFVYQQFIRIDLRYGIGLHLTIMSMLNQKPADETAVERQGLSVVRSVLRRVKAEYPALKVVGFSVDPAYDAAYREVFEREGLAYIPGISRAVRSKGNADCTPADAHWNHRGNELAGTALDRALRDFGPEALTGRGR